MQTKNVTAIIADDEIALCRHLQDMLRRLWPDLSITGVAKNGAEALSLIQDKKPQIAFLDIKMPELSGLQVAANPDVACHIVFITAYDEYAIQAFEKAAVDYLLKPVSEKRLQITIERLQQRAHTHKPVDGNWPLLMDKVLNDIQNHTPQNYLSWIRTGIHDKTLLIPVTEVDYFTADSKYTTVVSGDQQHYIKKPIRELASQLDPQVFWQIHRNAIVNIHCIAYTRRELNGTHTIHLKNRKERLIASRSYAHLFKKM